MAKLDVSTHSVGSIDNARVIYIFFVTMASVE